MKKLLYAFVHGLIEIMVWCFEGGHVVVKENPTVSIENGINEDKWWVKMARKMFYKIKLFSQEFKYFFYFQS